MYKQKKTISIITITAITLLILCIFITMRTPAVSAKTIIVSQEGNGNYTTIHEAIYAAEPRDRIVIHEGTYNESLLVDKPLDIFALRNKTVTIHDNNMIEMIRITADGTNISGFLIEGIPGESIGILVQANNTHISNNSIRENLHGIYLDHVHGTEIRDNHCYDNAGDGIWLSFSSDNRLIHNICGDNRYGIYLRSGCEHNTLEYNTCTMGRVGIALFDGANYNNLTTNECSENDNGLDIYYGKENIIYNNTFVRNKVGIYSNTPYNNNIEFNHFLDNDNNYKEKEDTWIPGVGAIWVGLCVLVASGGWSGRKMMKM